MFTLSTFQTTFLHYSWVFLFFILCYFGYEQKNRQSRNEYNDLIKKLTELKREKKALLETQEKILRQLNSQTDPLWIELLLMKNLDLIPEETTKVFFILETGARDDKVMQEKIDLH